MSLESHLQALADNIKNAVNLAQQDQPDLTALIASMDKIAAQIETMRNEWPAEEIQQHRDLYLRMQSNLELLETTLSNKSRDLQEAIGLASKRMQAHRKYAEANRE